MISKWVYPVESWKKIWNSEERLLAGEGNIMGVNKSTLESVGNEENQRLSSVAGHLMNECTIRLPKAYSAFCTPPPPHTNSKQCLNLLILSLTSPVESGK